MPELKLRLNLDTEEVELVIDDEVALSSGSDVFESWVQAYNEKHPAPVREVRLDPADVLEPHGTAKTEVDKEEETPVDSKEGEDVPKTTSEPGDGLPE